MFIRENSPVFLLELFCSNQLSVMLESSLIGDESFKINSEVLGADLGLYLHDTR